ncbi:MAG: hypothetical protein J0H12_05740 [Candidatus Paracaedimonas acanthamoebae]|uniref:Phospholipase D n=1 Tax=Candidatus Paracaedimonas acanthamoebae TaxID=244581 RepID=A0A8J7TV59_9PROT|nr:hypothetical protein [Candidatus Paracaedimonas acanthamoebae]
MTCRFSKNKKFSFIFGIILSINFTSNVNATDLEFEDDPIHSILAKLTPDTVLDPNMEISAFSSETSEGTIGSNIFNFLRQATSSIIIASDKCTNEEFLDDLIGLTDGIEGVLPNVSIKIVTGEDEKTTTALSKDKYLGRITHQAIQGNPDRSGKMHNKFIIVDDALVITGSPNLTYAAYNYNIESFVAIHHQYLAGLYSLYYHYIISGKDKYDETQVEYQRVKDKLELFNTPENPLQVCLAPILSVKDFVTPQLVSSQIININMFLISRAEPQDSDIIAHLIRAVQGGAQLSIKVDGLQYRLSRYMPLALAPLIAQDQSVYTVVKTPERITTRTITRPFRTKPQFHDKLVLIMQADGTKKICIGSAGFTDNVQDNMNLENMLLLKISEENVKLQPIYTNLLAHFNSIDSNRTGLAVTKVENDSN